MERNSCCKKLKVKNNLCNCVIKAKKRKKIKAETLLNYY